MKIAPLLPLATLLFASTAFAAVERKTTFGGETADALMLASPDGCRTLWLNVLTNDLQQKFAGDHGMEKVKEVFAVVHLDIYDQCTGQTFGGYADTTPEQSSFSLTIDPQHDRARFQGRLIMQDDFSFTFYWADIDISWTIGGPTTIVDLKDYIEWGDGMTASRTQGRFETRPAHVTATIDVEPYFDDGVVNQLIGDGISQSFDSIDTPADMQDFNRYSKTKLGDRTIYRTYDYVAP